MTTPFSLALQALAPQQPCYIDVSDHYVLVQAQGSDASTFLQGQLSQDVQKVTEHVARLSAWCDPKGRALASLLIWQVPSEEPTYRFLLRRDLHEAVLKRLKMFVLRAKVVFTVLEEKLGIEINAPQPMTQEEGWGNAYPVVMEKESTVITVPGATFGLRYWIGALPEHRADQLNTMDYHGLAEILLGIAWVEKANQGLFLLQELNYDALFAVNFRKGCYPGQEVVARSHYKAPLKRRAFIGFVAGHDVSLAVGTDIYWSENSKEPTGRVINSQSIKNLGAYFLFETTLTSTQSGELHLESLQGQPITVQAVPYSIEKPAV